MYPWGTYGWGYMWLGVAMFMVLMCVGLYVLLSGAVRSGERDRALRIARERYARGELTAEEFERMKRELQ